MAAPGARVAGMESRSQNFMPGECHLPGGDEVTFGSGHLKGVACSQSGAGKLRSDVSCLKLNASNSAAIARRARNGRDSSIWERSKTAPHGKKAPKCR